MNVGYRAGGWVPSNLYARQQTAGQSGTVATAVRFGTYLGDGLNDPDRAWQEYYACSFVDHFIQSQNPEWQNYYRGTLQQRPIHFVQNGPRQGEDPQYFDLLNQRSQEQIIGEAKKWLTFLRRHGLESVNLSEEYSLLDPQLRNDLSGLNSQIIHNVGQIIHQDCQTPYSPQTAPPRRRHLDPREIPDDFGHLREEGGQMVYDGSRGSARAERPNDFAQGVKYLLAGGAVLTTTWMLPQLFPKQDPQVPRSQTALAPGSTASPAPSPTAPSPQAEQAPPAAEAPKPQPSAVPEAAPNPAPAPAPPVNQASPKKEAPVAWNSNNFSGIQGLFTEKNQKIVQAIRQQFFTKEGRDAGFRDIFLYTYRSDQSAYQRPTAWGLLAFWGAPNPQGKDIVDMPGALPDLNPIPKDVKAKPGQDGNRINIFSVLTGDGKDGKIPAEGKIPLRDFVKMLERQNEPYQGWLEGIKNVVQPRDFSISVFSPPNTKPRPYVHNTALFALQAYLNQYPDAQVVVKHGH
jgi:hypothetical protein